MEGEPATAPRARPHLGPPGERVAPAPPAPPPRRRRLSSLTLRILATNLLVLAILVLGLFWLDFLRSSLINQKLGALQTHAEIIAAAVGDFGLGGPEEALAIDPERARAILGALVNPEDFRARLYAADGSLVADSRYLSAASRRVQLRYLPPLRVLPALEEMLGRLYDWAMALLPRSHGLAPPSDPGADGAPTLPEVASALAGQVDGAVRRYARDEIAITVAQPVQRLRRVQGALLLTTDGQDIATEVRRARVQLLQILAVALALTVLLSLFLAGTIARPIRRLAHAAQQVRHQRGKALTMPDLGRRRDEIGDLSRALSEMTEALYRRLDAIENFAADVAHEVRNPLASIGGALAAIERTEDPERRQQLMRMARSDLARIDRLIGDISNASRIDAELSRADREAVDMRRLLETAIAVRSERDEAERRLILLQVDDTGRYMVDGIPGRLGQVFDNLLSNAESFSPADRPIRIRLGRDAGGVLVHVDDDGPGLPQGDPDRLFQRFYTHRPKAADFGRHSGLGLSIARQVVEAHGGTIRAGNRQDERGRTAGARFTVWLPEAGRR